MTNMCSGASRGPERKRVMFDFSNDAYNRLQTIRHVAGASSNAELVRNSLRVYEWMHRMQGDGWELQLVKNHEARRVGRIP